MEAFDYIDELEVTRRGNQWLFSDGTVLPVVSGGSDVPPVLPEPAPTPEPTPEPGNDLGLGNDFLKNIPETDRAVVEKYVKDWDAGVTKRFQSIHDDYKPYKDLGELDDLRAALEIREVLDSNPEFVYDLLASELGKGQPSPTNQPGGGAPEIPKELEGLPQEFVNRFMERETMLENLAEIVLGNSAKQREEAEDRALEAHLSELKSKHGDFDEGYVLSQMMQGASGDDAVKAYQSLVQNIVNEQSKPKPQPPGLFGGGTLPADTPKVTDLTNKETRNLVAEILASRNQS